MNNDEMRAKANIDVSILLPTRGRVHLLPRAIESVREKSCNPKRLELCICYDNDDQATIAFVDELVASMMTGTGPFGAIQIFSGPRLGYARVFEHYNEMARAALGKFVLLWNDDAEMVTTGWDELLMRSHRPEVQFLRRNIYDKADTTLPFIDKRIVDALGGISRHMYTDTWIAEVADRAGVIRMRDDVVYAHHWPQQDATMREGLESIRKSGQHETFKAMTPEKDEDARKICELLAKIESTR